MNERPTIPKQAGSSAEEPRTPIAVREILSHVGEAVEELKVAVSKALPGGDELLNSVTASLIKATNRLLEKSHEYEARLAQLEQQERERVAAANPLGEIPSVIDPADMPAYLALIAQHLHQVQFRQNRSEAQQNAVLQKLNDMEIVYQDLNLATAERLDENRMQANRDIRESCDNITHSIRESRDMVLEAQANRNASPSPSAPLIGPQKLRKRRGDADMRATSETHRRKPSWHGSFNSAKSKTQHLYDKGKDFVSSGMVKIAHRRRPSEDLPPTEATPFQYGNGSRLDSIDEQTPDDTVTQSDKPQAEP